jgi:MFS family permease
MGVEAIQQVQPELRGTAVGAFAIFQDVAYGATAPIAGIFVDLFGYSVVFLFGMIAALLGLLIAFVTLMQRRAVSHTDVQGVI